MYHQTPRVEFVSKVGSSGKFNNILIQSVMSMNPRLHAPRDPRHHHDPGHRARYAVTRTLILHFTYVGLGSDADMPCRRHTDSMT